MRGVIAFLESPRDGAPLLLLKLAAESIGIAHLLEQVEAGLVCRGVDAALRVRRRGDLGREGERAASLLRCCGPGLGGKGSSSDGRLASGDGGEARRGLLRSDARADRKLAAVGSGGTRRSRGWGEDGYGRNDVRNDAGDLADDTADLAHNGSGRDEDVVLGPVAEGPGTYKEINQYQSIWERGTFSSLPWYPGRFELNSSSAPVHAQFVGELCAAR